MTRVRRRRSPARDRDHPSRQPAVSHLMPEPQCHFHRVVLVSLESDLLGQRDVARGEPTLRHEAPAADGAAQLAGATITYPWRRRSSIVPRAVS